MMSRATIIDERPDIEESDVSQDTVQESVEVPEQEQPQDSDIPEKYRGKSVQELVQMNQELEKFSGKQSTEVGELRKLVDSYIQTELDNKQAPETQQEDNDSSDVDFFVDPQSAVNRAIDNHPKIKEAETYTKQYKQQATLAQLRSDHPDMDQILQDPKFAEWIKGSKVRTQLFVNADQAYDYDSANELFSLWKERSNIVQQTAKAERASRKNAVKSATTGNARGTAERSNKKVYRRADIIKLMKTDPDRYNALSDEILKAYAEGRVR
ncbi:MAG: hypothetical protein CM15mV79_170 [uncultured marine virus]|jgi:hypothetical protein|nr:MAG: hypothetical protein CM15mV79_170 [uncultured marine virus]